MLELTSPTNVLTCKDTAWTGGRTGGRSTPNGRTKLRPFDSENRSFGRATLARRYGHVDETIFTESTLSRGEDIAAVDVAEPAADDELALDDSSIVPVTSTLCPA